MNLQEIYIYPISFVSRILNLLKTFINNRPFKSIISTVDQYKINQNISQIKPDHIFCQLVRTALYKENYSIPKTLDYMDALSKGLEKEAKFPIFLKNLLLKWSIKE